MAMTMRAILDELKSIDDNLPYDSDELVNLIDKIQKSLHSKIQNTSKQEKKTILVDFDGVINSYKSGIFDLGYIPDEPVPLAFSALAFWVKHYDVRIFSARCNDEHGIQTMIDWFKKHGAKEEWLSKLTFEPGKPSAHVIIDDRAIRFMGDFRVGGTQDIANFEPWYYRNEDWNRK